MRELLSKFLTMGMWRFASIAVSAIGSIWIARALGPTKLGISGVVSSLVLQGTVVVNMGLKAQIVRDYKNILITTDGQNALISEILSFRLAIGVALSAIWILIYALYGFDKVWLFPFLCGLLLLMLTTVQLDWLLQAQEDQVVQQKILTYGGVFSSILIFTFITEESPAGTDLAIAVLVGLFMRSLGWRKSISGKHTVRLSFRDVYKSRLRVWRGRWLFVTSLLIYCYAKIDVPILGLLKGTQEVGFYRSALQIQNGLQPFLALIIGLLYPRMVVWAQQSDGYLWMRQKQLLLASLILSLPAISLTVFLVPKYYTAIFGETYASGAWPCVLLLCSSMVGVVNGIFSWGLWAKQKDASMLVISGIVASSSAFMNFKLIPHWGAFGAAVVNCGSELLILVLTVGLTVYYNRRFIGRSTA